eukprot:Gb_30739 [translate_table: standard]
MENTLMIAIEDEWILGMEIRNFSYIPMEMKITIDMSLQIVSNSSDGAQIAPREIVTHIPIPNVNATISLDQILRVLSIHSFFISLITKDDMNTIVYSLTLLYKYLVQNKDEVPLYLLVVMNKDKLLMEYWYYLKYDILEGIEPFTKCYGVNAF